MCFTHLSRNSPHCSLAFHRYASSSLNPQPPLRQAAAPPHLVRLLRLLHVVCKKKSRRVQD